MGGAVVPLQGGNESLDLVSFEVEMGADSAASSTGVAKALKPEDAGSSSPGIA